MWCRLSQHTKTENNGLKGLDIVVINTVLFRKTSEGAGSGDQSGKRQSSVVTHHGCPSWCTWTKEGWSPLCWVFAGISALSSGQRGETKQFPCHLRSVNIHPSCSKRKEKKKVEGKEKKESFTFSVASQAGGKGQDKWILSRSLACGAHSLYRPARALLGEVINVFQLEQGAHCWSLDPLLG